MIDKKLLRNFDYLILTVMLILIAVGIIMITSATSSMTNESDRYSYVIKQLTAFGIGTVLMVAAIYFDYNFIGKFYWTIYGVSIVILTLVKLFGSEINGAKSWIKIGGFQFQPSEFAKILIIIFLAKFISVLKEKNETSINSLTILSLIGLLVSFPLVLVLIQPDFGTAMVMVVIIVAILFAAGLSYKYFIMAGLLGVISGPLLWIYKLEDYQKDRIRVFLNPDSDPLNRGFQVIQSKIAIGSGGFFGKGLFKGIQTQMGFLPFKETDFIFSVIGEELGFIWCMGILFLYGVLLLRLIDIVRNSKDLFGSLIVVGITAMIGIHAFQNIGMTIGLMPITGIPLPFISYGGTSLMANMIGIGLVLNVCMRKKKILF